MPSVDFKLSFLRVRLGEHTTCNPKLLYKTLISLKKRFQYILHPHTNDSQTPSQIFNTFP
ncbi:CLUMA_CG001909, isoform A [Clunio marinus]|uniref:CLUMA_CG001909, isoform A n=1 Tax=Clunio marinus TaxID=568069 RepID=A0A1J1HL43_9DIPT|nr:CLUMA_CG001909, isoform A [Clunio marinus]